MSIETRTKKLLPIMAEIVAEREMQDQKWGGIIHDDLQGSTHWVAYITKCAGESLSWKLSGKGALQAFRHGMLQVAATAVAAIEWADRRGE